MSQIPTQVVQPRSWVDPATARVLAGGGFLEAIFGCATIVLTIVALAGTYPSLLLPIAALSIAAALLFEGGAIASRFKMLLKEAGSTLDISELGGGLSAEFLGGVAGVILGILSLLGVAPYLLMPVAAIVFGGALLLGAAATSIQKYPMMSLSSVTQPEVRHVMWQATATASGLEVLSGLAAIVLGILALVRIGNTMELCLVSFLIVGIATLLSGTVVGAKMVSVFQHEAP